MCRDTVMCKDEGCKSLREAGTPLALAGIPASLVWMNTHTSRQPACRTSSHQPPPTSKKDGKGRQRSQPAPPQPVLTISSSTSSCSGTAHSTRVEDARTGTSALSDTSALQTIAANVSHTLLVRTKAGRRAQCSRFCSVTCVLDQHGKIFLLDQHGKVIVLPASFFLINLILSQSLCPVFWP